MSNKHKRIYYYITLFFGLFLLCIDTNAKTDLPQKPNQIAIASASSYATKAGIDMLQRGGNAFDAAVTVASVLAVTEPAGSGLGGGGFFLLHLPDPNNPLGNNIFIDARETAPIAATPDLFLDKNKQPVKNASYYSGKAPAIPGEVAGLVYLAKHYGKLPLSETLQPAIELAKKGFKVDKHYQHKLQFKNHIQLMQRSPNASNIFLINNQLPKLGDLIKQPDLANTLEAISKHGKAGFYRGDIARKLVKGVNDIGGIWSMADLANYKVIIRKPLIGHYHDISIITAPPPSAGGTGLITALNILSHVNITQLNTVEQMQLIIESLRRIYLDRFQFLADPDFVTIPIQQLLSQQHADQLANSITVGKATPSKTLMKKNIQIQKEGPQTTHFSIMDNEGNWVSATLSINFYFGSSLVPPGTGVLLNNEMDDFSIKPGAPNIYGIPGSVANRIEPGKRPLSSMSPTFVVSPDYVAILGTPGGSRIISMVLLGLLSIEKGIPINTWIAAPRYHQQFLPDFVDYEENGFSPYTLNALKTMGYQLKAVKPYGNMQAIIWNRLNNTVKAASDPRGVGLAIVEK